jgi:hypothetical protein
MGSARFFCENSRAEKEKQSKVIEEMVGSEIESGTQELKKLSKPLNVGIKVLTGNRFVYNWRTIAVFSNRLASPATF